MQLFPKFSKYKKRHKGKAFNIIKNNFDLLNNTTKKIKLISLNSGRLTTKQCVAIRFLIKKSIKKIGNLIFKISPDKPITKKPSETRMGKGKGSFDHWVFNVKIGITICEIHFKQILKRKIINVLKKAQIRLPIKTKIIIT